tara:strand:- start:61 stop:405 length:345 start_codon:yes stop_codon:yes gene_type:complete
MAGIVKKSFNEPDVTHKPTNNLTADVVDLGDHKFVRAVIKPGWKWSEHMKPVVGTDLCMNTPTGICVSGKMHIVHKDGTEVEVGPGDAYCVQPEHDMWIVGDEDYVAYELVLGE